MINDQKVMKMRIFQLLLCEIPYFPGILEYTQVLYGRRLTGIALYRACVNFLSLLNQGLYAGICGNSLKEN